MFTNPEDRLAFALKLEQSINSVGDVPEGYESRVSFDMGAEAAKWIVAALRRSTISLSDAEQVQPAEQRIHKQVVEEVARGYPIVALLASDAIYLVERNQYLREALVSLNEMLADLENCVNESVEESGAPNTPEGLAAMLREMGIDPSQVPVVNASELFGDAGALPESGVDYAKSDQDFSQLAPGIFDARKTGTTPNPLVQMLEQVQTLARTGEIDMNSFTQNGFAALIGTPAEAIKIEGDLSHIQPVNLKRMFENTREAIKANGGLRYTGGTITANDIGGIDIELEIAQA